MHDKFHMLHVQLLPTDDVYFLYSKHVEEKLLK